MLIGKVTTIKRRKIGLVATSVVVGVVAALTIVKIGWGNNPFDAENISGPSVSDVSQILNPSTTFLEDVAVVNGHPIKGIVLARQIEVLRAAGMQGDLTQIALGQLIEHAVLVQAGTDAGLIPSDDDIQAYLKGAQADLDAVPAGSMEREAIEALATGAGYDITSIASSPALIELARDMLTANAMRDKIVADLPAAEKGNPAAEKQAVDEFVEAYKATAAIEVLLPTPSP